MVTAGPGVVVILLADNIQTEMCACKHTHIR